MSVLRATNVTKIYGGGRGASSVRALDSFTVTLDAGEFAAIMGPSGSGKTTLLQILGTIDSPTSGEVEIDGQALSELKGDALALFRRRRLGFIFQDFNLLDSLTLKENIALPLALEQRPVEEIERKVGELAEQMGIGAVLEHYPNAVSGGEKQRAAAARALVHEPALVLADEPTGNLDSRAARALMEALAALNASRGTTILMVTHDPVWASYCRRVLFIRDGRPMTEVRRGEERTRFFHHILDVLETLGGEPREGYKPNEIAYARR
ncbi:MAG TPA: ABC transporter ATP-binding protein [Chloroflexota bacterium]|nr:ABC transporter ATP-binding protein [Chloroflexota bacterium]